MFGSVVYVTVEVDAYTVQKRLAAGLPADPYLGYSTFDLINLRSLMFSANLERDR